MAGQVRVAQSLGDHEGEVGRSAHRAEQLDADSLELLAAEPHLGHGRSVQQLGVDAVQEILAAQVATEVLDEQ